MVEMLLITIGSAILAVAAALWFFQDRLKAVRDAIDQGFKVVEDVIRVNLLNPDAAIDRTADTLNQLAGILDQVTSSIQTGKNIVEVNVAGNMRTTASLIRNEAAPIMFETNSIIHNVHASINIGIANGVALDPPRLTYWYPLDDFSKKLHDVDEKLAAVGQKAQAFANNIDSAANRVSEVATQMNEISNRVENISTNLRAIIPFVDVNFRNQLDQSVGLLTTMRNQLQQILSIATPQFIAGISALGAMLVAVGAMM
jgi:hypothetical protein